MALACKKIRLRLVEEADAEFILKLRLDSRYNKYLSKINPDLEAQKEWVRKYKNEERAGEQFYFIIERFDGVPCGTVRVYDLKDDSFCWGSWILNGNKTRYAALESAFLIYHFGFENLGYKKSHFDVVKGNKGVVNFHKRMGAVVTGEDCKNLYFSISKYAVKISQDILLHRIK